MFLGDNATHSLEKFYTSKSATNIVVSTWKAPEGPNETTYDNKPVVKMRTIEAVFAIDSTFVKQAPTLKTYRIIKNTDNCIEMMCVNRTREVPYCDTFDVVEKWKIDGIRPESKNCIVQIGITQIWHKSTMMKSVIKGQAEKEAKALMIDYLALVKQCPFVEQKRPAPKAEPGKPIEIEDYTTEKQLKAMFLKAKPRDDFLVA